MKKIFKVVAVVALSLVIAVGLAACNGDSGGTTDGGTDPDAAQYLVLFNQAVGVFDNDANLELMFNGTRAQLGGLANHYPAGLVRLAVFQHAINEMIGVNIILFDTSANANAGATEIFEHGHHIVGQNGRVVVESNSRNLVERVIEEIGGEILAA